MKPDGTSSFSTADEKLVSPKGSHVTEPDAKTGPAIKEVSSIGRNNMVLHLRS